MAQSAFDQKNKFPIVCSPPNTFSTILPAIVRFKAEQYSDEYFLPRMRIGAKILAAQFYAYLMITANAFIDWDSARRILRPNWRLSEDRQPDIKDVTTHIESCFADLQTRVINWLTIREPSATIRIVKSRIYHGWHQGKTETHDKRAWDLAQHRLRPVVSNKVSFLPDIEYGNELSCGGQRVPFFDTLRRRQDGSEEQKMVDTALVVDVLSFCRSESRNFIKGKRPESMAIIIGDDDDLLPGAFVSEKWGLPTYVLRVTRTDENRFIDTNGLTYRL